MNANNHEHRRVSCRYGSHRFVGTKLSNAKLSSVYCALTVRQSPIAIFDSYLFREGCRGKRTALFFYSPALESFREISTLDYEDYGFISWRYCDIFLDRKEKKRRVAVVRLLRVNRTGLRENFLEFFFENSFSKSNFNAKLFCFEVYFNKYFSSYFKFSPILISRENFRALSNLWVIDRREIG